MTRVVKQDGKYYEIAEGTGVFIEISKDEYDKLRKEGATISPNYFASGGEALKDVPEDNKGLPKLPKNVRNAMGFKKNGGEMKRSRKQKRSGMAAKRGYGCVMRGK